MALARMAESLSDRAWVAAFEKPKGDPSAFLKPATTVLSPHLKFGCLSARVFYYQLQQVWSPGDRPSSPCLAFGRQDPRALYISYCAQEGGERGKKRFRFMLMHPRG